MLLFLASAKWLSLSFVAGARFASRLATPVMEAAVEVGAVAKTAVS